MKMTRLEAIKAWEEQAEKCNPEEVREVLISTQQNDSSHDLHVEPTTAKVRVSKEQVKKLTVRNR
ncbi:hypothetical protein [Klebsiella pneumoniae]|uniref:hypothetical protein n=1 Tax=Klebsiella pneumoniae TaxID=573 RepID=UPI000F1D7995|nr:hypothetical protein [Klebsiella pneumoniae]VDA77569.1 hypothetical protein BANRA_05657 [Klebsiella pneumoniae]